MPLPSFFMRAAYHTSRPWPREAHRESTTYTFRSGYCSESSWAAIWAEWQGGKPPTSTSLPSFRWGSMVSVKSDTLTAEVVAISPSRSWR